jgi:hypothetical protein
VTTTGGPPSHRYLVDFTRGAGWYWVCSCDSSGSGPIYESEEAAANAARLHAWGTDH